MKAARFVFPFLLSLVIVILGLPLLGAKFLPTHDGEYHIIRFMEFFKMLENGVFFPRWAPTLNSGFGLPIFLFHYPFPNYIGSMFHALGFEFVDSFKLTLFGGYALAGAFCFIFLSKLWNKKAALIGAIASLTVPYWFVDIYVRGSVGEVWACAWMFGALCSIAWGKPKALSVAVALLVLSHNIQAMVFLPFILAFGWQYERKYILFVFLGLILSSYFWIPALFERSYVVGLNIVNPLEHFASVFELLVPRWGTQFSGQSIVANKMSFQIGVIPLLWLGMASVLFFKLKPKRGRFIASLLALWTLVAIYLMLPDSSFIWTTVPGISYIQYPWRLLSIFIPVVAIAGAYVASRLGKISIVLAIFSVVLVYGYTRPAMYERRDDAYYMSRDNFTDGTSSMGNTFSTIWTPWKQERAQSLVELTTGKGTVLVTEDKPLMIRFQANLEESSEVQINRLYFPGWNIYEDGKPFPIEYASDGVMNMSLSGGTHTLEARFEETPVRKVSNLLSIGGLLWLLGSFILEGIYAYRHTYRIHVRRA
jgi:hypothetical protein